MQKNFIPIAIVIAGVIIAGAFIYLKQGDSPISMQEAGEKSIAFINQSIQDQGVTASLVEVVDEGEVFRIHLIIAETEYDSYMTKSGKFLFPSGFNLEEQTTEETSSGEAVSYTNLDGFATCLTNSGAKFYGAFWCSHCQNQKAMFGDAQNLLPYVECSTPDGEDQLDVCNEKEITGYPTWIFADGSRESGEVSLQQLSEKTECQLQ